MEIWKDIIGFEGLYQISSAGLVKSVERIATSRSTSHWYSKHERILFPEISSGYYRVIFSKNGTITKHAVHRLVATAFIPNLENKPQVNHIDGNKLNNHISNLEWVTASENVRHAIATGLKNPKLASTYISEDIRELVRSEYIKGSRDFGCVSLAAKYKIGKQSVINIVNKS